jgi:Putative Flp pilus-assembly TadE/G-like
MGLAVDVGYVYVEHQRLQAAVDAAAIGAALLLPSSPSNATLQAAALQAVTDAAGGAMIGTLNTPITVSRTSSSVTVTLVSASQGFFTQAFPTLMSASATAGTKSSTSCVLALASAVVDAIQVDNMGSITGSSCGIFSDSSSSASIYLNSGTIRGTSVGAVGGVQRSNSGSNTLSPAPVSGAVAKPDPYASRTVPTYGSCNYNNASFTAWRSGPYQFTQSQNVFCGNTTIGGNGTTDTFAPGVYYVVNGNLTFNNAGVTSASGVTFVLTGTSPGAFSWTNSSGTYQMSAPISGATAGILVWQTCGSGGISPASQFAGGSTLQISGAIYAPCGELQLSNNAQIVTATGGFVSVVADTIDVTGSAGIAATASSTSGNGGISVALQP